MNRCILATMATLAALTFTACEEAAEPVEPPPPPPPVGTISGAVTIEGTGVSGVTVTLSSGATMATGAGGGFSFTGVDAGSHTVSISTYPADATFASTVQVANITADGQTVILDFTGRYIRASSLVGTVVAEDAMTGDAMTGTGGMPDALDGVTVTLGGEHARGESTVTVHGSFAFTGLRAGAYTLTISAYPSDVAFETPTRTVEVGVGEAGSAAFTGRYIRTSSISGSVQVGGDGLDGVEVTLTGAHARGEHAVSADGGQFAFGGLRAGAYTVMIGNLPGDVTFPVTSKNVTVGVGQAGRVSFSEGGYVRSSSIVGVVATSRRMGRGAYGGDGDEDGVGGVDGVRVSLSGEHAAGESAFTGNGGHFAFTALRAGAYTVVLGGLPGDVRFETMSADVEVARGQTAVVSDFENGTELFEEGTIGGQLYVDGNENQAYERAVDGRLALAGATITLEGLGSSATSVDRTTTTDEEGRYGFDGLDAGTYRVWIDSREQVYADSKVRSNGPGSLRIDLREGRSGIVDFPFVITEFEVRVAVVFGHDDEDNESPAEGVGVGLYRNSDGTGLIGGRTRKTDDTGVATFALSRDELETLAAQSVVFSGVTAPDETQKGEDPFLAFKLDRNSFVSWPDDDHNLLWTTITLTVGYVDQSGAPVPDGRISGDRIDFMSRIEFPEVDDGASPFAVKAVEKHHDGRVEVEIDLTHDADGTSYGKYVAYDGTSHIWRINFGGANAVNAPAGSVRFQVRNDAGDEFDFAGEDGREYTDDDLTLPRVAVEGDGQTSDGVQYVEADVDGSVNQVHLGDFTVSYPFPEIKARVWHETNDIPGYQAPPGRRQFLTVDADVPGGNMGAVTIDDARVPGLVMAGDSTVGLAFELEYLDASLPGDEEDEFTDGVIESCTEGLRGDAIGILTCIAPASARDWRLVAIAKDMDSGNGDPGNPGNPNFGQPLRFDEPTGNPKVVLLADGGSDYEIELDEYDVIARVPLEPTGSHLIVDLGHAPFTYKYTGAALHWIPFNRGGTRAPDGRHYHRTNVLTAQGDVPIRGMEVMAIPDDGMLGNELIRMPTAAKTTGADEAVRGGAVFQNLLEGRYTVAVVGQNLTGGADDIRTNTGRTMEDMRAVLFTAGRAAGHVPLADLALPYAVGMGESAAGTTDRPAGVTTALQEVEYRGTITGYVFNNQDDDSFIADHERIPGVMVVAMLGPCVSGGMATASDTTRTDATGRYSFKLWEASDWNCYAIAPRGVTTQPATRPGFAPGGLTVELFQVTGRHPYDYPSITGTNMPASFPRNLAPDATDTDFEVVYDDGSIDARITDLGSGEPVVMEIVLEHCAPPNGVIGGPDYGDAVSSTTVGKTAGGPLQGCDQPWNPHTLQTDSTGRVVWTGLPEGYYRVRTTATDSNGNGYVVASETVRLHQRTSAPVAVHVNLAVTARGG